MCSLGLLLMLQSITSFEVDLLVFKWLSVLENSLIKAGAPQVNVHISLWLSWKSIHCLETVNYLSPQNTRLFLNCSRLKNPFLIRDIKHRIIDHPISSHHSTIDKPPISFTLHVFLYCSNWLFFLAFWIVFYVFWMWPIRFWHELDLVMNLL